MDLETNRRLVPVNSGKYVIAVSGGVDSVVLLDILHRRPDLEVIVAHFDHGIRDDSATDAVFVGQLADSYQLPFVTKREVLGRHASEERARNRRYTFLRDVAHQQQATLITAHHADDVIETIAINLHRGTGWRGLAVLDSDIVRPLLNYSKAEIMAYAQKHALKWREDNTNNTDIYLRNRLRRRLAGLDDDSKRQVLALWSTQTQIKQAIDQETSRIIGDNPYSRYLFTHMDQASAIEALRFVTGRTLTRPQLVRAHLAVKTARTGSTYQAGDGVTFDFSPRNFVVKLIK